MVNQVSVCEANSEEDRQLGGGRISLKFEELGQRVLPDATPIVPELPGDQTTPGETAPQFVDYGLGTFENDSWLAIPNGDNGYSWLAVGADGGLWFLESEQSDFVYIDDLTSDGDVVAAATDYAATQVPPPPPVVIPPPVVVPPSVQPGNTIPSKPTTPTPAPFPSDGKKIDATITDIGKVQIIRDKTNKITTIGIRDVETAIRIGSDRRIIIHINAGYPRVVDIPLPIYYPPYLPK